MQPAKKAGRPLPEPPRVLTALPTACLPQALLVDDDAREQALLVHDHRQAVALGDVPNRSLAAVGVLQGCVAALSFSQTSAANHLHDLDVQIKCSTCEWWTPQGVL